jgi:hypothetical protein
VVPEAEFQPAIKPVEDASHALAQSPAERDDKPTVCP